jgi:hypothetical protein
VAGTTLPQPDAGTVTSVARCGTLTGPSPTVTINLGS